MDIQKVLDLIEKQLDTEMTATELAETAGYSVFYFYRLFQKEVGMPVMQYITRRKLLAALTDISEGMSITEAALKYGFATHSGFFRAFVKEYGLSPSDYLQAYSLPNQYQVQLGKERFKFMNNNQIKKLLPRWNLDSMEIKPVYQPNSQQRSEHVWQVGENYFLKMFSDIATMKKELSLIKRTNGEENIIATVDRNETIEWNGNYFVMLRKTEGESILSKDVLKQPDSGRYIDELIGQITLQLAEITGDFPENDLLETTLTWALPRVNNQLDLPSEWVTTFQGKITELFPKLPKQVIHRDLHGGNLLLAENSATAIDFDLAELNFRIYDPCYYLTSVLSEQFLEEDFQEDDWLELADEVLLGYDQIICLTAPEKAAIPYVMLANQLICVAYFSEYDKYQQLLEANVKITQWMIDIFEKLKKLVEIL